MLYIHEDPLPAISPGSGPLMQLSHLELSTDSEIGNAKQKRYGKVWKLRTPGKFGHTFANSENPDLIKIFPVC